MDKYKNSKQPQRYHYDPELTRDFGVKAREKGIKAPHAVNSTPRVRRTAILGGSGRIGTEKGEEAKIQHPHPPQITPGRPNQMEIQRCTWRNLAAAVETSRTPPMDSSAIVS